VGFAAPAGHTPADGRARTGLDIAIGANRRRGKPFIACLPDGTKAIPITAALIEAVMTVP
jgi:hypothetical protein